MSDGKLGNVAQSDLRRVSRAAVKATKSREELRQAIQLARASGETLQDIGAVAGVSAERIRQIVSEKS
jgi:DNA-directed RNA polymerase sigma subunit (sigma70/sigma32)